MLRFTPIEHARQAEHYYSKSDGGYYLEAGDLHREWGGQGAALLGLAGTPDYEQFKRLIHGLDPHSGEQLTAKLIEDRIPGWDVTASVPKGVTTALERGDARIRQALWEAGREAMADLEERATTRVRKGGKQEDRVTGNLVWYATEHPETRPAKEDGMPDWDRHIHFVVFNLCRDNVEGEWKAVKFRPIMDLRKYYSMRFDLRLASKLTDLGYSIETKTKADNQGGKRYYSWDIKGIPASVVNRFSRRSAEVEQAEKDAVKAIKAGDPEAPDTLSAVARDKLGATSRQRKQAGMTLADYREYWSGRVTPEEGREIAATIQRAIKGLNPKPANAVDQAVQYATLHHFERNSVVRYTDLAVTAMERCLGGAQPEEIEPEFLKQGVLFKDGQATTQAVLEQEGRILGFAREGRGSTRPLADEGKQAAVDLRRLSADQQGAVRHVWTSPDQLILIQGGAGTGKTTMMKSAIAAIGKPVVVLAPSADASRSELRAQGFATADTVAQFMLKPAMQERARGGVIWVDEAGLLPIKDLDRLCGQAHDLGAKLILQGDPKQHKAVARHGNMLSVLREYGGLPAAELKEIQRQQGDYAAAVAAIRDEDFKKGDRILRGLGWMVADRGHAALIAEYAKALHEHKAVKIDGKVAMVPKSVLVIDPTHKDGDQLGEALRTLRKEKGLIEGEEQTLTRLVPLSWTEAEKGDAGRYGDQLVQFFRSSGPFKAGERVRAADLLPHLARVKPDCFQVYAEQPLNLAKGDIIRITAGGKTKDGHRIDNGRIDTIAGFNAESDPILANGWVLGKSFGHVKHGLVSTSHAAQSKTHDIVLAALNRASLGAMGAEQGYVTISRGRERGMLFTDLAREELLAALRKKDVRGSATELLGQPGECKTTKLRDQARAFVRRMRDRYRILRERLANGITEVARQVERGMQHAGQSR